jgi:hypothetical protein
MRPGVARLRRTAGALLLFCVLLGAGAVLGQPLPSVPGLVPGPGAPTAPVGSPQPVAMPAGVAQGHSLPFMLAPAAGPGVLPSAPAGFPQLGGVPAGPVGPQPPVGPPAAAGGVTQVQDRTVLPEDLPSSKAPGSDLPFRIGYDPVKGIYIDTIYSPDFPKTTDGKFPFELDIRGRIQADYYYYKVVDKTNHLTGVEGTSNTAPDESVFEVKRMRLIFAGWAWDPDLRYQIQFDGNTRGLNTENPRQNAFSNPIGNTEGGSNIGSTDAGVRLLEAWIAYDFHGKPDANGYSPTLTLIGGKLKPMGSFEEYLTSATAQFVEFSMASWMFDSDADNYLFGAGFQVHAFEDRFFAMALITNGSDNQVPNYNMGNIPGANLGWWYDFGGTQDPETGRWKLYGNSISDIDWSENPVLRVGSAADIVPGQRRSQYTSAQLDFFKAATAAPGGTNVDQVLGGGTIGTGGNFTGVASGQSPFAVDAFDVYTYDFYFAAKYQGFSLYNEWWVRDYDNFRGERNTVLGGNYPILYTANSPSGATSTALFDRNSMIDFGTAIQTGYFLIPHKLEIAARYDLISGVSGDINGNGTYTSVSATSLGIKEAAAVGGVQPANTVPLGTTVRVVNGAFTHYHVSQEIAVGVNVFFFGEKVKWQTDVGLYTGGNPAVNGQSPAGYLPGVDGYMVRTQVQFSF